MPPRGNPPPRKNPPAEPLRPGQFEYEFGIPFAGVIAEPARWTRTALHPVPPGHLDWRALFGRDAPVVLDIGCGNGRSTLHSAVQHPECDHLAIDTLPVVIRYATRRANQRGLANVRCAVIGGRELLASHIAPHSVSAIHIFHPQPFDDPGTSHRRLLTPEFLGLAFRTLIPGGRLVLQTDHSGYWSYLQGVLPQLFDWQPRNSPWPEAPKGMTRREIMATARKLPIYRGEGTARTDLTDAEVANTVASLPPAEFPTDRRSRELDREEASQGARRGSGGGAGRAVGKGNRPGKHSGSRPGTHPGTHPGSGQPRSQGKPPRRSQGPRRPPRPEGPSAGSPPQD